MKRLTLMLSLALTLIPAFLSAAPTRYQLQTDRSEVGFIYRLSGAENRGTMPVRAASITIDFEQFGRSQADVTVDVSGAKTGFIFATEALKSQSVLHSAAHPTIRFQSTAIRANNPGNLSAGGTIEGFLTIRGVTRPVSLQAALFRQQGTAEGDLSRLSFRISGTVRRSDFGAAGYSDIVDDLITLDIAARVTAIE